MHDMSATAIHSSRVSRFAMGGYQPKPAADGEDA
jgi:hypothetical protein